MFLYENGSLPKCFINLSLNFSTTSPLTYVNCLYIFLWTWLLLSCIAGSTPGLKNVVNKTVEGFFHRLCVFQKNLMSDPILYELLENNIIIGRVNWLLAWIYRRCNWWLPSHFREVESHKVNDKKKPYYFSFLVSLEQRQSNMEQSSRNIQEAKSCNIFKSKCIFFIRKTLQSIDSYFSQ